MTLGFVGLNHRTASLNVRSRAALTGAALTGAEDRFPGAVVLSTCNRTEVYFAGDRRDAVLDAWSESADFDVTPHVVARQGDEVVRHLFRVVAGLESAVLGEAEIVTQVRAAYRAAAPVGVLDLVFRRALEAGKRVRTETELCRNVVSVGSMAVREASAQHGGFADAQILVLGAGQTAERVAKGLRANGARRVRVLNRTPERARLLAESNGFGWGSLGELNQELHRADIVFAAATAPRPIVTQTALDRALANRTGRKLTLIDLGVPRNVAVGEGLPGLHSLDLDGLEARCARNADRRAAAVPAALAILEEEIARYEAEAVRRAERGAVSVSVGEG